MLNLYTEALSHLIHAICLSKSVFLDPNQILSKQLSPTVHCINYMLHYVHYIHLYPNIFLSYLFVEFQTMQYSFHGPESHDCQWSSVLKSQEHSSFNCSSYTM